VNPLRSLHEQGQAIWLDFLSRRFIADGELKKLVLEDGLSGVTSNPSIFKKAIGGSSDYDASLSSAADLAGRDAMAVYESLAVQDIQNAAEVLRPVYKQTERADGFVSLEVSPYLANDTEGTIAEARRLWKRVDRENVMIKVPATEAGLPAICRLIGEGLNINITLLFSRTVYARVAAAYLEGLEQFLADGGNPGRLSSVASFFVSRIDTAVDKLIDEKLKTMPQSGESEALAGLRGKIAIANAKLAYQDYQKLFGGERWRKLSEKGARVQRLLWASTSTKNPAYSDVLYVDELIGPDTINTMPPETIDAFRGHGKVRPSLEENVAAAQSMFTTLAHFGISLEEVTTKLTNDGVQLFADAFDDLLGTVEKKRAQKLGPLLDRLDSALPPDLDKAVGATLGEWKKRGNVRRLWQRDASLWTGKDESKWLGWLDIIDEERRDLARLQAIAADVRKAKFTHAVLLGMGGSSLGAEVFAKTFGPQKDWPKLLVLDSTDPAEIANIERQIDLQRTLFIVSSKSGTTLEPNILKDHFYARVEAALGKGKAGSNFLAITDPGSKLANAAGGEHFRMVCLGKPDIGGRYSVLSDFGLVPAAVMGVDIERILSSAQTMVLTCGPDVPPPENSAVALGVILGTLAQKGRDKVTIVASPGIADFGAWLEQLLAESTGKVGKGLIPVDAEPLGPVEVYGDDRLFIYLRLESAPDRAQDDAIANLQKTGQPVVWIAIAEPYHIAQEFFRWQVATAVAGAVIGINPFDQPDVEASKVKTRELMQAYERSGSPRAQTPLLEQDGIKVYAHSDNAAVAKATSANLLQLLRQILTGARPGDYCALLAYIAQDAGYKQTLQEIRALIRDKQHIATCLGFGPRFLHSTGQAYKGGPNTGIFLQITADHTADIPVPGRNYSFGSVLDATAEGDFAVLNERGRRALRMHLGKDIAAGLKTLKDAVAAALA
jgi:transaldolase/glucose-6-phosphate isomerase